MAYGDGLKAKILAHPGVQDLWSEMNGSDSWGRSKPDWWVGLNPGWCCPMMECHTVHEDTLTETWNVIKGDGLVRCGCSECDVTNAALPDADVAECRCAETTRGLERSTH